MSESAGPDTTLPPNLVVLPGVVLAWPPKAAAVEAEALLPYAFELDRLARDLRLARDAIAKAQAAGLSFRSNLLPMLDQFAGTLSYKAGEIEADAFEAQGLGDCA